MIGRSAHTAGAAELGARHWSRIHDIARLGWSNATPSRAWTSRIANEPQRVRGLTRTFAGVLIAA
jgi:hypothetical protein